VSNWISRNIDPIGDKGKLTLHEVIPINRNALVITFVAVLVVVLVAVELLSVR
jgi:uncharacterized protein